MLFFIRSHYYRIHRSRVFDTLINTENFMLVLRQRGEKRNYWEYRAVLSVNLFYIDILLFFPLGATVGIHGTSSRIMIHSSPCSNRKFFKNWRFKSKLVINNFKIISILGTLETIELEILENI